MSVAGDLVRLSCNARLDVLIEREPARSDSLDDISTPKKRKTTDMRLIASPTHCQPDVRGR